MSLPVVFVVAGALIDADGHVLLAQRPEGKAMSGLWEFPGGKLEAEETPEAALARELDEELGIDIIPGCLAPLSFVSHRYPCFHIIMLLYVCRGWQGIPQGRDGQSLVWVRPQRLRDYPMLPADQPLIAHICDLLISDSD